MKRKDHVPLCLLAFCFLIFSGCASFAPMANELGMQADGGLKAKASSAAPGVSEFQNEGEAPLRQYFPETLYFNPELITDDQGRAQVEIPLADSITTWRIEAYGSTKDGQLVRAQAPIRVFQDFFINLNLPTKLTVGDEISLPVLIYNYSKKTQSIEVRLKKAPWFQLQEAPHAGFYQTSSYGIKTITIPKEDVASIPFRIRVKKIGFQSFQVTAKAGSLSDGMVRSIEVLPNGKKIERSDSQTLTLHGETEVFLPPKVIPSTPRIYARIYPAVLAQIISGLEGMMRQPHG